MFHVNFEPSTAAILNGPVTSLGLITKLKPGKTGDHVAANMTTLTGAKNVNGCTGTAFGKIVENDQFAFMTGWNTIEVRDHQCFDVSVSSLTVYLYLTFDARDFIICRTIRRLVKSIRLLWISWDRSRRQLQSGT